MSARVDQQARSVVEPNHLGRRQQEGAPSVELGIFRPHFVGRVANLLDPTQFAVFFDLRGQCTPTPVDDRAEFRLVQQAVTDTPGQSENDKTAAAGFR